MNTAKYSYGYNAMQMKLRGGEWRNKRDQGESECGKDTLRVHQQYKNLKT